MDEVENNYRNELYPNSSYLLDIVRSLVQFNNININIVHIKNGLDTNIELEINYNHSIKKHFRSMEKLKMIIVMNYIQIYPIY